MEFADCKMCLSLTQKAAAMPRKTCMYGCKNWKQTQGIKLTSVKYKYSLGLILRVSVHL